MKKKTKDTMDLLQVLEGILDQTNIRLKNLTVYA